MANGKKRSKWRRRLLFLLLLGLVAAPAVWYWRNASQKEKVITVQTEKIQKRTITQLVTASGKIQPETMVKINAEVSGEILALPLKEGQQVNRGDLIVKIKPDQYQAQVDRAEASLVSAKAQLALQQANLEKSSLELARVVGLYQQRLASEQDFTAARIARQVSEAQNESAKAGISQAQATLKEARENLAKTLIYAPMTGIISQLRSEVGERVSGSSFTQGTEMMTIADLAMMEARVDVGESDIVLLAIGKTATLEVDSYPQRKFKGAVAEIANTGKTRGAGSQDEVTTFEVKIRIADKNVQFRPGMSVTVDIETETKTGILAVPIQCVTTRVPKPPQPTEPGTTGTQESPKPVREGKAGDAKAADKPLEVVFLMANGRAKMVPVKRGLSDDAYVEITEGVAEDQEVVTGSFKAIQRELEDGVAIALEEKQPPGAEPRKQ